MKKKSVHVRKLRRILNSIFREIDNLQPYTAADACARIAKISYEAIKK